METSSVELEPVDGSGRISLPVGETVIGRGPFLGIADKRVSRNHGVLEVVGEKLRIKSIASIDCTTLNVENTLGKPPEGLSTIKSWMLEINLSLNQVKTDLLVTNYKKVHLNPCFYQPSGGKSQFVPLEKNKWQWLSEGDSFSLLPDTFIFRVLSTNAEMDSTLSNSQNLDDENELMKTDSGSDGSGACKVSEEEPSCSTKDTPSEAQLRLGGTAQQASIKTSCKSLLEKSKVAQRERELPAWMLQGDLEVKPLQAPPAKAGARRRKVTTEQKASESPQGKKRLPPAVVAEASSCEVGFEKKSRTKPVQKTAAPTQKATPRTCVSNSVHNLTTIEDKARSKKCDIPETEEDLQPRNQHSEYKETDTQPSSSTSRRKGSDSERQSSLDKTTGAHASELSPLQLPVTEDQEEMDTSRSPVDETIGSESSVAASQALKESSNKRIPCAFGQQCYRKNPAHFQECNHPGDSDYCVPNADSQDDDDERPECPYGTDCYRKNPQHKLEYKHTKPPETESRRTRRKTTQKGKSVLEGDSDDDGEPNEYDLNDSFLDDEEEEYEPTDEDSDYEPDFEEKDSEDMGTLIKEANKFVKTKK